MKKEESRAADQAQYYRLHTDAIDDLVSASEENTPRYSREELEKYTTAGSKRRFPVPLKVFLIKAWFYGAVCFFVFWGLGLYVGSQLDLCVIAALLMGMVTDLLINSLLRFGEKKNGESAQHMMVVRTGIPGLMLNMLYAFLLMFMVVTVYAAVNALLAICFGGQEGAPFLGVGPIGFGLFAAGLDTLFIGGRRMLLRIAQDARVKAGRGKV